MLVVRGVNVFPSQVETALLEVEETLPHYQIVLTREKGLDALEVRVEVTSAFFSDEIGTLELLRQTLEDAVERESSACASSSPSSSRARSSGARGRPAASSTSGRSERRESP